MKINYGSRFGKLWSHLNLRMFPLLCSVVFSSTASFAQTTFDVAQFISRAETIESEDIGDGIVCKTYTDNRSKAVLTVWRDGEMLVPRMRGAIYCYVVPGPNGHFLRKAWISADGVVVEEERRNYDSDGRLVLEGYIDPSTGVFLEEFRHRYSNDGKTQYTTQFSNGVQVGAETSRPLDD
jgi:antitoxin component YwqK of YwqJK toxin-antitoxin module